MSSTPRYRAFISYSHRNADWGTWLHRGIERYRVPAPLVGRETRSGSVPKRLFPIFRDREELPTASDLGQVIEAALADSAYLIVICSPEAAQSRWVDEEIRQFKALHGGDRVLAIIVDGEPNATDHGRPEEECFPNALRYQVDPHGTLSDQRTEPIAADARDSGDGREDALLKVLAGLLGVNFNDLKKREAIEARRRARRAQAIAGAMALLAGAAVVGGAFAYLQKLEADDAREIAEDRRLEAEEARGIAEDRRVEANAARERAEQERDAALVAQSRFLADRARSEARDGNPGRAILMALEALPRDLAAPDRPFVPSAAAALSSALQGRIDLAYQPVGGPVADIGVSPDGQWVYIASTEDGLYLGNGAGQSTAKVARLEGGRLHWAGFSPDSRYFAAETNEGVAVWRLGGTPPEAVLRLTPDDLYETPPGGFPNIGGAAFSPDSTRIAVIETTGRLSIISLADGTRQSALLDGASDEQRWFTLGWTGIGLVAAHDFNMLAVIDPRHRLVLARYEIHEIAGSQFAANLVTDHGTGLVLLSNDLGTALVDLRTGRVVSSFETEDRKAVRFSPDGAVVVVPDRPYGANGRVVLLDALTGQEIHRHAYADTREGVMDVAIARNGRTFDEVYSGVVYRRDVVTGEVLATRRVTPVDTGGSFFSRAVALANGTLLLGTWRDASAVWTPDPSAEPRLVSHDEEYNRMAWVAGGERLMLAQTSSVPVLADPATGDVVARLGSDTALAEEISISPDTALIVVPAENAPMAAYLGSSGALAWRYGCRVLGTSRFVSGGLLVPSGCDPGVFMTLVDPADGSVRRTYEYRVPEDSFGTTFARLVVEGTNGALFAATSADMFADVPGRVLMFGPGPDDTPLETLSRPGIVDHLLRAPGGPVLAAFDDGWLAALDPETGAVLWEVSAAEGRVELFTGGDGRFAVTVPAGFGDAGGQRIWDLASGELVADMTDLRGMGMSPDPVFDPKGRWIQLGATSGVGKSARVVLWDTGRRELTAQAPMPGFFGSAAVISDGSLIARVEGRAVGLWDGDDLQRMVTLVVGADTVHSLAFSPDGRRVAAMVPAEGTWVAPVPMFGQYMIDAARRLAGRTLTGAERNNLFLPPAEDR